MMMDQVSIYGCFGWKAENNANCTGSGKWSDSWLPWSSSSHESKQFFSQGRGRFPQIKQLITSSNFFTWMMYYIICELSWWLNGQVDDKYQYSSDNKDNRVHGWICPNPVTGFWMITPSNEFNTGGPLKQDLTSHVGPTTLSVSIYFRVYVTCIQYP